jgi:hypothetical protein
VVPFHRRWVPVTSMSVLWLEGQVEPDFDDGKGMVGWLARHRYRLWLDMIFAPG